MSWWHLPHTASAAANTKRRANTSAVYLLVLLSAASISQSQTAAELLDAGKLVEAESAARLELQAHSNSADAHYLLGYILFKENKPKESLAEYQQGTRLRAPTALELEVIGGDYFLLEDYVSADKWLTQSVNRDSKNPLALYLLGRTKYNERRFEEAVRFFAECLKIDANNAKAEYNLGLAYEQLGRKDDAVAAYRSAIASDSRNAQPYLHLGTLLVENGRSNDAIPYLVEAAQLDASAEDHRELGKAYLSSNDLEKAQSELEKAAQLDPQSAPTHFLLAQIYRKRRLPEKATVESKRYSELTAAHSSPDDPLREARSLIESSKLTDAEQVIRRYLDIHKNSADAHYLLGYILFREQKAKDSLAEYTDGAKYRRPSAQDLEVVGGDYVLLQDYEDADKWFTKSVEWDPHNVQALYYLGRAKYNENRFEEAISVFQNCLKLDARNVKAEDNLGLAYEGLGRVDDAIAAYRTAIAWQAEATVKEAGPYIDLGNILVENDRSSEALPYLTEAVRLAPQDLRAHRALGKAYLHTNQLEKAQAEFEKCVQVAPESAPTHFMLAQVYRKLGMPDKARAETQRYAELSGTHSSPESSH